jgi:hypothetical protein
MISNRIYTWILTIVFAALFIERAMRVRRLEEQLAAASASALSSEAVSPTSAEISPFTAGSGSSRDPRSAQRDLEVGEVQLLQELEAKRARGDLVLESDNPFEQRRMEEMRERFLKDSALTHAEEYERIFGESGLSPETSRQLQDYVVRITRSYANASSALGELKNAQENYKRRLKQLLSPEDYDKYWAFEADKPTEPQVSVLKKHLMDSHVDLDPALEATLKTLVRQSGAYMISVGIPRTILEGIPPSSSGEAYDATVGPRRIAELRRSRTEFVEQAIRFGLLEMVVKSLASYYDEAIDQREYSVKTTLKRMKEAESDWRAAKRE